MTTPIVFLIGCLLVWHTGMYMFDLNQRPILWAIVAPIQIKHVHSSVSYQQAINPIYDRHVYELPSGYGPLGRIGLK